MVPATAALAHVPMPDLGEPGAPGPFSLADPERIRTILADSCWADVSLEGVGFPMRLGGSVDEAMDYMESSEIAEALMRDVDLRRPPQHHRRPCRPTRLRALAGGCS
jgi:hypothetical protein